MATILVVDDELGIRALLSEILTDEGHTVELAEDAAQARVVRESLRPDLVLLDIWMPDVDGVTLLKEWSASGQLQMPVIMMSGHGTIDTAVEATKYGASAFLEKPITLQKLLRAVEQALVKPAQRLATGMAPGLPAPYGRGDAPAYGGDAGALAGHGQPLPPAVVDAIERVRHSVHEGSPATWRKTSRAPSGVIRQYTPWVSSHSGRLRRSDRVRAAPRLSRAVHQIPLKRHARSTDWGV